MNKLLLLINIFGLLANAGLSQITGVKSPGFSEGSSSGYSRSGMPNANFLNNWDQLSPEQRNQVVMKMHGAALPPSQEEIRQQLEEQLKDSKIGQPKLSEYEKISFELIRDAYNMEAPIRKKLDYYKTPEFKIKEQPFKNASSYINQMLSGAKPLSLKDAYFQVENAFGNSYLSYKEYCSAIKESANFIRKWLLQNGYDLKNNEHLHIGIQKFMKDTLSVNELSLDSKKPSSKRNHIPFRYDYMDFKGETDHRNYYITKALATGYGQCNSLPGVYLVIAEELGAKAYLSIAPQHSLAKYPDNKGNLHNYEPTSHYKLSNKWYSDHFHISNEAIISGIYLDTMNKKMVIADCLNDLCFGYLKKLGIADGQFILRNIETGMKFFSKGNNIRSYFLRGSVYSRMLERIMYEKKVSNIAEISRSTEGQTIYSLLIENEKEISRLGYQAIPEQQYLEMMEMHTDRAKQQENGKITGKEKRNLFFTFE